MKLYLVYGDTWFGGHGTDINIFGVFDTLEKAELVKVQAEEKYFKEDQESRFSELDHRSEVKFYIKEIEFYYIEEIETNAIIDKNLGGYEEWLN